MAVDITDKKKKVRKRPRTPLPPSSPLENGISNGSLKALLQHTGQRQVTPKKVQQKILVPVLSDPRTDNESIFKKDIFSRKRLRALLFFTATFTFITTIILFYTPSLALTTTIPSTGLLHKLQLFLTIFTISFLTISTVAESPTKTSILQKPHPLFWTIIKLLSILYISLLLYLLLLPPSTARSFLSHFDPSHTSNPVPDKNYALHCAFTLTNIHARLDPFIIAHTLGWFAKALLIRERWLLWVASVGFEIVEMSFQGMLKNFGECWWDRWGLDVGICNLVGIEVGLWVCQWGLKEEGRFFWMDPRVSVEETVGLQINGEVKRKLMGNINEEKKKKEYWWYKLDMSWRLICTTFITAMITLSDLNAFFLKKVLWIEVDSALNAWRLILFAFIALPAVREFYQYTHDPRCSNFGKQARIIVGILFLEIIVCVRFGMDTFEERWYQYFSRSVVGGWGFGVVVWILLWGELALRDFEENTKNGRNEAAKQVVEVAH